MAALQDLYRDRRDIVLVQRHADYTLPVGGAWGENQEEAAVRRLSRQIADGCYLLSQEGADQSFAQGVRLAEGGRIPRVWFGLSVACQSAAWISRGIESQGKAQVVPAHLIGADYPAYNPTTLREVIGGGDRFVAAWLNGQHPSLMVEGAGAAQRFANRVQRMIQSRFTIGGFHLVVTHFEVAKYVHSLYVRGNDLGSVDTEWMPTKSGGIALVRDNGRIRGVEYTPDFTLVEA